MESGVGGPVTNRVPLLTPQAGCHLGVRSQVRPQVVDAEKLVTDPFLLLLVDVIVVSDLGVPGRRCGQLGLEPQDLSTELAVCSVVRTVILRALLSTSRHTPA